MIVLNSPVVLMAPLGFRFALGEIAVTRFGKIFKGRDGFVDVGRDYFDNDDGLGREDVIDSFLEDGFVDGGRDYFDNDDGPSRENATDSFLEDGFGSTRSKVEGSGLGLEGLGSQLVVDLGFMEEVSVFDDDGLKLFLEILIFMEDEMLDVGLRDGGVPVKSDLPSLSMAFPQPMWEPFRVTIKESIPHGLSLVNGLSMKDLASVVVWSWCLLRPSFFQWLVGLEGFLRGAWPSCLGRGLLLVGVGLPSDIWFTS